MAGGIELDIDLNKKRKEEDALVEKLLTLGYPSDQAQYIAKKRSETGTLNFDLPQFNNTLNPIQKNPDTGQPIPLPNRPVDLPPVPDIPERSTLKNFNPMSGGKEKFFTPEQLNAIQTGDVNKLGSVFSNKVPVKAAELSKSYRTPSSFSGATLESASPQEVSLARRMLNGDIVSTDIGYRDRGRILMLANELADKEGVPFQSYLGNVRKGMSENLAYGKIGMNSLSLNTALGHTSDAMEAYKNIENTNQAWLNKPLNWLRTTTNNPDVIALGLNLNALQGELANVFKNSGGTDQEISKWRQFLNQNLTPSQAVAAGKKIHELLLSRLDALKYQQGNVMKRNVTQRELLSPKGKKIMEQLKTGEKDTNVPQGGKSGTSTFKAGDERIKNGKVYVRQEDGTWQPKP